MAKLKKVIICKICGKPCGEIQGFKLHLRGKHGLVSLSQSELESYISEVREGTYAEVQKFKEEALKKQKERLAKTEISKVVEQTKKDIKTADQQEGTTYSQRLTRREAKRKAFLKQYQKKI